MGNLALLEEHKLRPVSPPDPTEPPKKRKRGKVRAAWIGFSSRILAQLIGAVATIGLGLVVMQRYAPPAMSSANEGRPAATAAVAGLPVIAVLPLLNFTGEHRYETVADGLSEVLVAHLAQMPSLKVVSTTSSRIYKQQQKPLRVIASELGANYVVEGSIVRDRGRVRVIAQLIDASTDQHVWAQSYDRPGDKATDLPTDVADAITREVGRSTQPRTSSVH
jgi:TolB-like protein